jgi:Mce-associated membrane protein
MSPDETSSPTWYDILGLGRNATPEEIKAAWRAATDKFEPGSGTSQFRLFNEAADVLLDPTRREAYDAELGAVTGADLSKHTPPEASDQVDQEAASTDVEAEVEPVEEVEAEPDEDAAAPAPSRRSPLAALGRLSDLAIAGLAVLAVAAVVLAVVLALRAQHRVDVADAGPTASAAAERALGPVLSYDYRPMEADRDRAAQFLTPSYKKDYLKNFNDLLIAGPDGGPGPAVKTKAVVTADVLDTGVVDADADRVRVIAFVNQSSVKGDATPTILQNRLVVTMVHRGNDWLVDQIKSY